MTEGFRQDSSSFSLFGVFDGHGPQGKAVSCLLADKLPKILAATPAFKVGPLSLPARRVRHGHTPSLPPSLACSLQAHLLALAAERLRGGHDCRLPGDELSPAA